jgi:hypothetical protein
MPEPSAPLPPEVIEAFRRGSPIEAIKLLRKSTGLGLKEAKEVLDALKAAQRPVAVPHHNMRHLPHVPHVPHSRSGLSPGEVPRTGAGFGWVLVLAGVILAIYFLK